MRKESDPTKASKKMLLAIEERLILKIEKLKAEVMKLKKEVRRHDQWLPPRFPPNESGSEFRKN